MKTLSQAGLVKATRHRQERKHRMRRLLAFLIEQSRGTKVELRFESQPADIRTVRTDCRDNMCFRNSVFLGFLFGTVLQYYVLPMATRYYCNAFTEEVFLLADGIFSSVAMDTSQTPKCCNLNQTSVFLLALLCLLCFLSFFIM